MNIRAKIQRIRGRLRDALPPAWRGHLVEFAVFGSLFGCGLFTLTGRPSPTVERQGGEWIVYGSAAVLLVAGVSGLIGVLRQRPVPELLGTILGALAAAVWTGSLILQAIVTGQSTGAAAACFGMSFTALLALHVRTVRRRATARGR